MIKILFSDLDGTLLEAKHGKNQIVITERNQQALLRMKEEGIRFCIASGRNRLYTDMVQKEIGQTNCDVISCNGAAVMMDGQLQLRTLPLEIVRKLVAFFEQQSNYQNIRVVAVSADCTYIADRVDAYFLDRYGSRYPINKEETIFSQLQHHYPGYQKIMVLILDQQITYWQQAFRSAFASCMDIGCAIPEQLEFMAKGVNKGAAIHWFQKQYGLSLEEIAVIGDADNDLPMLREAKYSFVVESGEEGAKKEAYRVVKDVAECVELLAKINAQERENKG